MYCVYLRFTLSAYGLTLTSVDYKLINYTCTFFQKVIDDSDSWIQRFPFDLIKPLVMKLLPIASDKIATYIMIELINWDYKNGETAKLELLSQSRNLSIAKPVKLQKLFCT